jgi:hypothetical protein
MSLSAFCLAAACLWGSPFDRGLQVSAVQDVYSKNEVTDRLALLERHQVFGGVVFMGERQAVMGGAFPLRIGTGLVEFRGGFSVASDDVPLRGVKANWVARLDLRLSKRFTVGWFHISNSLLAPRHQNPSLDALALTWRLR